MEDIPARDLELLIRDKHAGDRTQDLSADLARLKEGEPLAYVIGWVPFLGLRVLLDSKPLIPRPETEAWTEDLIGRLRERFGKEPFHMLDLCAGSGAIGLSVLQAFPAARVTFGEIVPAHADLIRKSLAENALDAARAVVVASDLFASILPGRFDIIATNPPYVPEARTLDVSVTGFEPGVALYGGPDGLALIRTIAAEAASRLAAGGELWMECDIANIDEAAALVGSRGALRTEIRTDPYGRPRVVVGYYP